MTIGELRKRCQPASKAKIDPLMEVVVLRPFSIYFTWLFIRLGLQANHVSFLGFLFAAAGSGCLLAGERLWGLAGAGLIWTAFLLDCVDGEVARYRGHGSARGTYLDYLVGMVNDGMILVGLAFYVSVVSGWDPRWTVVPSAFLALSEKLVGLTAHSVVFRNIRSRWEAIEPQGVQSFEASVWREMSLRARLLRVPFETFFRVSLVLAAAAAGVALGTDVPMTAAWLAVLTLGFVVSAVSFRNEFFRDRVGQTMDDVVKDLQSRTPPMNRAA